MWPFHITIHDFCSKNSFFSRFRPCVIQKWTLTFYKRNEGWISLSQHPTPPVPVYINPAVYPIFQEISISCFYSFDIFHFGPLRIRLVQAFSSNFKQQIVQLRTVLSHCNQCSFSLFACKRNERQFSFYYTDYSFSLIKKVKKKHMN